MAFQPNVNRYNYLLNNIGLNDSTQRTTGLLIATNPGAKVDFSNYDVIGFCIRNTDAAYTLTNIITKSNQTISSFYAKQGVFYPIAIKSLVCGANVSLLFFYREP